MAAGIAGNPGLYWAGLKQEWNRALHDPVFVATLLLSMAHASVRIAEPTVPIVDVVRGKSSIWTSTKKLSSVENAFKHWENHKNEFPEFLNAKQHAEV